MAGLEPLYAWARPAISRPQDALVCGIHWELIRHGYRCLGAGDQPGPDERKSELLPAGWEANKEVYTLRYKSTDDALGGMFCARDILGLSVPSPWLLQPVQHPMSGAMPTPPLCLPSPCCRVYKNTKELSTRITSGIIAPLGPPAGRARKEPESKEDVHWDEDPLRLPPRQPMGTRAPTRPSPLSPFAVGGEDLDPFGGRSGGMIVDPLHSGIPQPGIDPSSGIPGRLPPGAVPPGARFDPFGPLGVGRPGPDPDHLPPPGYDDMFM
ncbi:PSMF1 inhibitor, partial [Chloropsis hardwickii]|nr:PSMF1 inhibitor [Chloropsis hardwickii]